MMPGKGRRAYALVPIGARFLIQEAGFFVDLRFSALLPKFVGAVTTADAVARINKCANLPASIFAPVTRFTQLQDMCVYCYPQIRGYLTYISARNKSVNEQLLTGSRQKLGNTSSVCSSLRGH